MSRSRSTPTWPHDTAATIDEATHVPRRDRAAEPAGQDPGHRRRRSPAIEEMTARGRSINVTLIFSLTRHRQVIEAYLRGLERLIAVGGDPSAVHSVASFFVSRVDTETDRRLAELGREDLKGRLGIANARLAYQQYKHAVRRRSLAATRGRGATKQRCLWASTSAKDPSYRDTLYVEELIGPETISTMPEETIRAFQDHGRVEPRLESDLDDALILLNELSAAGVDYDDVAATLEREGIQKFVDSLSEIFARLESKRRSCGLAQMRPSPERDGWLPHVHPGRRMERWMTQRKECSCVDRSITSIREHPPQRHGGDGSRRLWTLGRARPL